MKKKLRLLQRKKSRCCFLSRFAQTLVLFLISTLTFAQTTVSSLADLLPYLDDDNVEVTLSPGTYSINADDVDAGTFTNPLLLFEGSNSIYNFTGVTINIDTDVFQKFGSVDVKEIQILGNYNVISDLTIVDIGDTRPSYKAQSITMDGSNNTIQGMHLSTSGSYPYGYGDAFGKGGGPVIKHYKHSAVLIRGEYNTFKNSTVIHRAYGHSIFMQAASYPTIEGCYVEGEMRTTDDMLAEAGTGSAADNVDFMTVWGYTLPAGYMMSLQEAGIRAYNAGTTYINGEEISRGTDNPTVVNCVIKNTRTGVTLAHATGTKYVEGCTVIGCEQGYSIGSGTIYDCSADAVYGPVFKNAYSSDNGYKADITVLPPSDSYYNGQKAIAYIGGSDHDLTFRCYESDVDQDYKIMVSGDYNGIRMLEDSNASQDNLTSSDIEINNITQFPLVMASDATGITGKSCGTITDNGSGNSVEVSSDCSRGENLALSGVATQSSTNESCSASLAIDGNTSGEGTDGSVTQTISEENAWWQVDLGADKAIEQIVVYNRTDGIYPLCNFKIEIINSNQETVYTREVLNYTPDTFYYATPAGYEGQYVKVQLTGTGVLALAEVEVYEGEAMDEGTPMAGKTYYIDNPRWDKRLAANGGSTPYTTSTSTTGAEVQWTLTESTTSGYYYIDCNGGGSLSRLCSDESEYAAMTSNTNDGALTEWMFTEVDDDGVTKYLFTTSTSETSYPRLRVNDDEAIDMVGTSSTGSWTKFVFTEVEDVTTAISDHELEDSHICIYPNPVSSDLNIKIENDGLAKMEILSITGKIVLDDTFEGGETSVNLSQLSKGIYIIKIQYNDVKYYEKIVKL